MFSIRDKSILYFHPMYDVCHIFISYATCTLPVHILFQRKPERTLQTFDGRSPCLHPLDTLYVGQEAGSSRLTPQIPERHSFVMIGVNLGSAHHLKNACPFILASRYFHFPTLPR